MENLLERLKDFKILTKTIKDGEFKEGYSVEYNECEVSCYFKEVDNVLVVMLQANPVRCFQKGEEEKAKKICYQEILKYLRKNAHVAYGEIWDKYSIPYEETDGSMIVAEGWPIEDIEKIRGRKFNRWELLSNEEKEKYNKKRAEKRLSVLA